MVDEVGRGDRHGSVVVDYCARGVYYERIQRGNVVNSGRVAIEPLLARYAVRRSKGEELPGFYDAARSLWVVPDRNGPVPLVEAGHRLRELETKTKVDNEQDDSASHVLGLASSTETRVGGEQEDAALLSLLSATITEVKTEADDLA